MSKYSMPYEPQETPGKEKAKEEDQLDHFRFVKVGQREVPQSLAPALSPGSVWSGQILNTTRNMGHSHSNPALYQRMMASVEERNRKNRTPTEGVFTWRT